MKVFLDTNIFIEYTTCRKQFRWVRDVFDAIEDEIISAVASVGGMYTKMHILLLFILKSMVFIGLSRQRESDRRF